MGRAVVNSGIIDGGNVNGRRTNAERNRVVFRKFIVIVGQAGSGRNIVSDVRLSSRDSYRTGVAVNESARRRGGEFLRAVIREICLSPDKPYRFRLHGQSAVDKINRVIRGGQA